MSHAIRDFDMISEDDRILVAVSGGKDSYTMHYLLTALRGRAPVAFSLLAVNIDQGQPGFASQALLEYMQAGGHEFRCIREDTYRIVTEKTPPGKTRCSLCSRLRRGILYRLATEFGCNKIALGHHRDDVVVTFLLNCFFSGQLKAMPPRLLSDDGAHVVIRPLAYCAEKDIREFAREMGFKLLSCSSCEGQDKHQRKELDRLLASLECEHPNLRASMMAALMNVRPSHLLDRGLSRKLGFGLAREDEADAVPASSRSRLSRRPEE